MKNNIIEKNKLLIIDDSEINRMYIKTLIEDRLENFDLYEAPNGEEGIKLAIKVLPDVILLDIMMPDISGYEVCKVLKKHHKTSEIPIIFLSALNEVEDKARGFEVGGVDYITKPAEVIEVMERIKTHTKLYKTQKKLNDYLKIMDKELNISRLIQRRMLPDPELNEVCFKKYKFSWFFLPSFKVSGDIFGIINLSEDEKFIYIVDVSGHGFSSTLLSLTVKQSLENLIKFRNITDLKEIALKLEKYVKKYFFDGSYFTLLLLKIKKDQIVFSSFGHLSPIFCINNEIKLSKKTNLPLGLGIFSEMAEENYEEETYNFNKNDSFFIYTDGLIETEIEGISERLISEKLKKMDIEEVNLDIRKILKKTYDEENPFEDDITYLICKKTGDD